MKMELSKTKWSINPACAEIKYGNEAWNDPSINQRWRAKETVTQGWTPSLAFQSPEGSEIVWQTAARFNRSNAHASRAITKTFQKRYEEKFESLSRPTEDPPKLAYIQTTQCLLATFLRTDYYGVWLHIITIASVQTVSFQLTMTNKGPPKKMKRF